MNTLVQFRPTLAKSDTLVPERWIQLLLGVISMMAISSPQYVWSLMTKPLMAHMGASLPELQVTFSILIVLQTFFSPFQGYFVDRLGPRIMLSVGALLTGLSWILAAQANTVTALYLSYGLLGGLGTGIIYVGVVGLMVRWFPTQRGLAVGLVAAGYGFGAIVTTFPIAAHLAHSGVDSTLTLFGFIMGCVGFVAAQFVKRPPSTTHFTLPPNPALHPETGSAIAHSHTPPCPENAETGAGAAPRLMVKQPVFWLMFLMMAMMSTSGLMVISQMGAFAHDFGVADLPVWGMAALPLALTIDRFTNGLTRPFFGWLSDRLGRENTMAIAFGLEAVAMSAWLLLPHEPILFVLLSGVVFFGWGEIFSLFPSTLTDTFGARHATTNYGLLYMSQGVGSILGGPLAALLHRYTGTWEPVFMVMIALDAGAALLALFLLKPMRLNYLHTR